MRAFPVGWPLLLTALVCAQTNAETIVPKLIADLIPLKLAVAWDEPLHDAEYTDSELKSLSTYSQNQALKPFQNDFLEVQLRHVVLPKRDPREHIRIGPFIGPDQAYKLGYVLTGKDLTVSNLKPLVESLLGMLKSAEVCRQERSLISGCVELRQSAENTWVALQTLGVTNADMRIVMNSLLRGAANVTVLRIPLKYQ